MIAKKPARPREGRGDSGADESVIEVGLKVTEMADPLLADWRTRSSNDKGADEESAI